MTTGPVLQDDRGAFLAALDRNAPKVLKSLRHLPFTVAGDEHESREDLARYAYETRRNERYVEWWVRRWPPLRSMGWFRALAAGGVHSPLRSTWLEWWEGVGESVYLGENLYRLPPAPPLDRVWNSFTESEDEYREWARHRVERHIAEMKLWKMSQGYADPPSVREWRIPAEKRWDLLVRRAVLRETYEQLRDFLGWDEPLEDKAIRGSIRRCATRVQMRLDSDVPRSPGPLERAIIRARRALANRDTDGGN